MQKVGPGWLAGAFPHSMQTPLRRRSLRAAGPALQSCELDLLGCGLALEEARALAAAALSEPSRAVALCGDPAAAAQLQGRQLGAADGVLLAASLERQSLWPRPSE